MTIENFVFDHASEARHLTLVEILSIIAGWHDLSPARRAQLSHFVRKAMSIQRTVEPPGHGAIRFTCEALNATLWLRSPSTFGMRSGPSFNNFISGCRVVLTRLGLHEAKTALMAVWQDLYDLLPTRERRMGLVCFMRYCSCVNIGPVNVDSMLLDRFEVWCQTRQLKSDIHALTRRTASGWNWAAQNLEGWPTTELTRRNMREEYTVPLEAYPLSFQADVRAYLDGRAADPREGMFSRGIAAKAGNGPRGRRRAAKPRTIKGYEYTIRAAAAALVLTGTPIEAVTSLRVLVEPLENAEKILQFHFERRKAHEAVERFKTRPTQLISVGETLRQIAKFHCRISDEDVAQLAEWLSRITPETQRSMNDKNRSLLRVLFNETTHAQMLHLPQHLSQRARSIWVSAQKASGDPRLPAPLEAARLMMYAVAIEILLFCPLRRSNLVGLHLDQDLIRVGPQGAIGRLVVMAHNVKNNVPIDWLVPTTAAELMQLYIRDYRPTLTTPENRYLFPGQGFNPRNASDFGTNVGNLVERETGAEFNMHLARHFSVVRHLRLCPGEYALVSRLLGHANIEITIRYYAGLEADAAAEKVNKLLDQGRMRTKQQAAAGFRGGRKVARKVRASAKVKAVVMPVSQISEPLPAWTSAAVVMMPDDAAAGWSG